MTYENKIRYEQEMRESQARAAMQDWQNCPLSQLESAAKIFDGAIVLLIQRYARTSFNG
jgi:hypothetical protein